MKIYEFTILLEELFKINPEYETKCELYLEDIPLEFEHIVIDSSSPENIKIIIKKEATDFYDKEDLLGKSLSSIYREAMKEERK